MCLSEKCRTESNPETRRTRLVKRVEVLYWSIVWPSNCSFPVYFSTDHSNIMTKESTPPTTTDSTTHQPPSAPTSPLSKRPKLDAAAMSPVTESTPTVTSSSTATFPPLLVKKLVPEARAPTRGSALAAGYDLYCAKKITIPAKGKGLVSTGLAIAVPHGTCKSGLPRTSCCGCGCFEVGF